MAIKSALVVKTPIYEGPLDLLLDLIEKRKLLINDISLASVADEYIAKIEGLEELPIDETAQFVALAATLLLIKSRSLLPTLELSDDEVRDIRELEYRLEVYKIIKEAGRALRVSFDAPPLYQGAWKEPEPLFVMDTGTTLASIEAAARRLMEGFPQNIALPKVAVKKIISLEEMIESLSKRVQSAIRISFKEFAGKKERTEVIVGFLALLELVKQGIIKANQDRKFGDIVLESDNIAAPTYE
ncbi:MAG TPA: segregation/condensation protein A [Candidatus Paceibacterota bacterium]|nr:segregation/condensation protein A [Candidatus Paceibacterota bacterium]